MAPVGISREEPPSIGFFFFFPGALNFDASSDLGSVRAGYYSYLYAKCFASSIWKEVCCEDPLSPAAGSLIRAKFLEHGGARDPSELLKDLAGEGVVRRCAGGGIIPDVSNLCEEMNL